MIISRGYGGFAFGEATVSQGSTGGDVRTLQTLLNKVGANGGVLTVDGVFGAATRAAVVAFQNAYGLTADGVAGPDTWTQLKDATSGKSVIQMPPVTVVGNADGGSASTLVMPPLDIVGQVPADDGGGGGGGGSKVGLALGLGVAAVAGFFLLK